MMDNNCATATTTLTPPVSQRRPPASLPAAQPSASASLTASLWPYLLLAVLTLIYFWDFFFAGKIFLMRDMFFDCFPWRLFSRMALRSGHLPFWNPYSLCGQPYLANTQTAVFYPLHILYYVLPPVFALKLWIALHLLIAAAGMFALARHWRLEVGPALLAGLAYAFSTHVVSMLEFQSAVPAIVATPLSVLLVSRLLDAAGGRSVPQRRWFSLATLPRLTALLALFYAAQFLAGHLQSLINALLIVMIYLTVRCLAQWSVARVRRFAIAFGAAGVLAIGLCLPQLLLTMELIPLSVRSAGMPPGLAEASLHPIWLLGGLMPFIGGHPGNLGQWWGDAHTIFEFWASALYIGVPGLIFLPAALAGLRRGEAQPTTGPTRRVATAAMLAVFAFGLMMAMGQYTPLYMFFYHHVPIFDKLRWPSKFLQLVVFAAAALAGLGFQAFLESRERGRLRRGLPAAWLALFIAMLVATFWVHSRPGFFTWFTAGAFKDCPDLPDRFTGLLCDWSLAILFLGLTLAALAPFALGRARGGRRLPTQLAVVAVAFLNLFIISRQVHPITDDDIYRFQPEKDLLDLLVKEPGRVSSKYIGEMQGVLYGQNTPEIYRFAATNIVGEYTLPHQIFHLNGGDVLQLASYHRLFDLIVNDGVTAQQRNRAVSLMNLRWMLYGPPLMDILTGHAGLEMTLSANPTSLPRAMVMENWCVVPNEDELFAMLLDPQFDPYRVALLSQPAPGLPARQQPGPLQPDQPITTLAGAGVESVTYDWNRIDLVATARRSSLLFLDEVNYPGWKATVDGRPEPLLQADLIFRAVRLTTPGRHTVSFTYCPRRFTFGLVFSAFSLFLLVGVWLWVPLRRHKTLSYHHGA